MFPAVYMVLVGYIVPFGNEHVAAMRVGHTIEGLTFFAALGMGMAMRPIVGQNLGAGQPERAEKAAWTGAAMLGIPVLAFSATMFFAPEAIASLITDATDVTALLDSPAGGGGQAFARESGITPSAHREGRAL